LPISAKDEPFQAQVVGDQPVGAANNPLLARWENLSVGDRVWADGDAAATFLRGELHPGMAGEL
ncbi:unnamed protein product, partial [Musa textilis]